MAIAERTDAPHAPARLSAELLDRLPPQNLEAEKAVLGSILLDPQMCDDVALLLRPDDFYADANQKLFGHVLAMHDEGKRIDIAAADRAAEAGGRLRGDRRRGLPGRGGPGRARTPPTPPTTPRSSATRRSSAH